MVAMSLQVALRHHFPDLAFDIAFDAPTPGTTVLFGPSGAGKSTVVAAVAGLLRPESGRVVLDRVVLADPARSLFEPPERRRIGLVFQDTRLFPHLSVRRNLTYGLRRVQPIAFWRTSLPGLTRQSRGSAREMPGSSPGMTNSIALPDVVDLLGIGHLLDRRPHTLSGGERQRVAIGRALLSQPQLLVMDEPLASLDAARKDEILPYLLRLKTAFALPILYVTHALDEVARLADTLVLIEAGRVVAAGPVGEIAARADLPLAARDDAGAILAARVQAHDSGRRLTLLDAAGIALWVPLLDAPVGGELRARVPAREVILATDAPQATSIHNTVEGQVRAIADLPARHATLVEVASGSGALLARVTPDAVARLRLAPGGRVLALVKSMAIEVLAPPPLDQPGGRT
jgi:molybdate transport system ATP-binding protein